MTTFTQIIQMRNSGKTQEQIAQALGISRRSVIRYLKQGKVPVHEKKTWRNKPDPMEGFYNIVEEKLSKHPSIVLEDLFLYLQEKGYKGSSRTLRRKTTDMRKKFKNKEVFFQREALPGEVMEGDFTEFKVQLGGKIKKIYLWVSSLPYSNTLFSTGYFTCSFEAFADGSERSFKEFGGVAKKYRLDNMSPAVSKILQGKERKVTARYAQFQSHFGFAQDFCNPGRGNEKGNVEVNNKHLKRKLKSLIELRNLSFCSLEAFNTFLHDTCREHNLKFREKFFEEKLIPLPEGSFPCFRTEIGSINKYSTFSLGNSGHNYSVPSHYIGLSLEVRIYPERVEVYEGGECVAKHKRLFGPRGMSSIKLEHVIGGLLKKPGAMKDWKHRNILFERSSWKKFYKRIKEEKMQDKDYLQCLRLIKSFDKDLVTAAMEVAMEKGQAPDAKSLLSILSSDLANIHKMGPIETNLLQYDDFLKGETN